LFILSIGFDGIFNAIQFSKYYIKKDLTESHIIKNIPDVYNINTIARYEYYLFVNCIAFILLPLKLFIRTIFIYVVIIPPILYKLNTSNYGQYIKNKKNLFLKEFLSKHISKYIEKHSNNNFKIHHGEIMQLLSIENDIENIFWIILKNLLIIQGIGYLKRNYSNISYNVIKKFYTYKTGTKINSITVQEANDYIKNVIDNKEWFKLYDVQFTNCLRIIYNQNTNGSYLYSLQFKILYFFSLWSFGFILPTYIIPPLFLLFEIYRTCNFFSTITALKNKVGGIGSKSINTSINKSINTTINKSINTSINTTINKSINTSINKLIAFKLVNILFSFILSLLLQQEILLISFITVFGYPLLFNDLTLSIIYEIWKKKQIVINIHKLYSPFKIEVYHIKLFIIYLLLTFINNFNTNSILINTYILYITNNMINYYINSKRIYIDENDYSIIFINKPCLDKGSINDEPSINDERKGNIIKQGNNEHKGSNKDLVYTLDDSYYNFSINPSQLEESMIIFK
jgi:hypothetical protein